MSQEHWSQIDNYLNEAFSTRAPALQAALQASSASGLPAINVAPNQGKLLQLLARSIGARKILEIDTLGGYSAIWLARALPTDGRTTRRSSWPRCSDSGPSAGVMSRPERVLRDRPSRPPGESQVTRQIFPFCLHVDWKLSTWRSRAVPHVCRMRQRAWNQPQ